MFTSRIFALVAFAIVVAAGCDQGMNGVCCNDKPALTPRGYSAADCAAASGTCAPKQYHMCCQSSDGHTASVCSSPTRMDSTSTITLV
ncbi:hypothetical protein BJ138DRAFT_1165896 [Hygrophoropsis aurantiaca]|uniref:Uncharacterized protein n=1 Tax=Hygrophoropsis aurantiaca TaxID=72124 RepID=A0ACB7ZVQ3_9AGAM|nr:hypothetical protein BJ138DRAFT_1165896 [Hygrophoropsis aurantiaca]